MDPLRQRQAAAASCRGQLAALTGVRGQLSADEVHGQQLLQDKTVFRPITSAPMHFRAAVLS
jgi:hypothetical protein